MKVVTKKQQILRMSDLAPGDTYRLYPNGETVYMVVHRPGLPQRSVSITSGHMFSHNDRAITPCPGTFVEDV